MRGMEDKRDALFIYLSPEDFVPADHPLRPIRTMVDQALESLSAEFDRMYSHTGRPSIPLERLRLLRKLEKALPPSTADSVDPDETETGQDRSPLGDCAE